MRSVRMLLRVIGLATVAGRRRARVARPRPTPRALWVEVSPSSIKAGFAGGAAGRLRRQQQRGDRDRQGVRHQSPCSRSTRCCRVRRMSRTAPRWVAIRDADLPDGGHRHDNAVGEPEGRPAIARAAHRWRFPRLRARPRRSRSNGSPTRPSGSWAAPACSGCRPLSAGCRGRTRPDGADAAASP